MHFPLHPPISENAMWFKNKKWKQKQSLQKLHQEHQKERNRERKNGGKKEREKERTTNEEDGEEFYITLCESIC